MAIHPEVEVAPPEPLRGTNDGLTAGALLSLIAHSHYVTLPELLLTAQVRPKKLLCLLKELQRAQLIELEGTQSLDELDGLFERHQTQEFDSSEVPFLNDRRALIAELALNQPASKISISRRGFGRALAL
jgi:hypothetical protein